MIQATARVLHSSIEMEVGGARWTAEPVIDSPGPIGRRLQLLFSTVYETRTANEPGEVHSTVSYLPKKDEVLVQIGEQKWRTHSTVFGPASFDYGGITYVIVEKLTGRFAILREELPVVQGELGFRTCTLREYPPELEAFLANLCLGYLIRTLFWAQ